MLDAEGAALDGFTIVLARGSTALPREALTEVATGDAAVARPRLLCFCTDVSPIPVYRSPDCRIKAFVTSFGDQSMTCVDSCKPMLVPSAIPGGRFRSSAIRRPAGFVAACIVAGLVGACTSAGDPAHPLRGAATTVGFATTVSEPKDFVKASRSGRELAYIPIGRGGLERPIAVRNAAGIKSLESELDRQRDAVEARARRPLPRGAYGQPLPSSRLRPVPRRPPANPKARPSAQAAFARSATMRIGPNRIEERSGTMNQFHRIRRLPPYVFEQVNKIKAKARAEGADIIDLGMGNPDMPAPKHVLEKLVETVGKPRTDRYSASKGIPGLRRAQAAYYARRFGVKLNPDTQVVATLGSKEGFANMAQAITGPGDVVLVPNPSYPIHAFGFLMAGGVIRSVPAEPSPDFFAAAERSIIHSVPKPIALVVCYPSNPTAMVASLDFYKDLVAFAKKHDIILPLDLAYAEVYFDDANPPPSVLQVRARWM